MLFNYQLTIQALASPIAPSCHQSFLTISSYFEYNIRPKLGSAQVDAQRKTWLAQGGNAGMLDCWEGKPVKFNGNQ